MLFSDRIDNSVRMLYDRQGLRKYLTETERQAFRRAALAVEPLAASFALTLLLTGCRISEALALTGNRVDFAQGMLTFESLKKRRRGVYRSVPVPDDYLAMLREAHALADWQASDRLWKWSRSTASVRVAELMLAAGVKGAPASAKGLRHGFAVACIELGIPLNVVQKWLGHAHLSTTAIYAAVVGEEERRLAARLWN